MNCRNPAILFGLATLLVSTQVFAESASTIDATQTPLRIVIIGDSTVCNYPTNRPERGWGMFIEERFKRTAPSK